MKIAIVGIRGIPVIYSGFETFAEKLATEFVKKGHSVTVYCRSPYVNPKIKKYQGITLKVFPVIRHKNFETFIHSLLSTLDICIKRNCDLVYYMGVGSAIFALFPRIFGIKTAINVDGLDWRREKWGFFARLYLHFSEWFATFIPNLLITDSLYIKNYYLKRYKKNSHFLAYGFFNKRTNISDALKRFVLRKNGYLVWIGRLVPENHVDDLIKAFKKNSNNIKCVIAGDSYYENHYKNYLKKLASNDKRIIFTGFLKRNDYETILKNAFAYIETKASGGSHPSLIEAMGLGSLILSNNHQANQELLGENAVYYKKNSLKDLSTNINMLTRSKFKKNAMKFRNIAKKRAYKFYNWKRIIKDYEVLFKKTLTQSRPHHIH